MAIIEFNLDNPPFDDDFWAEIADFEDGIDCTDYSSDYGCDDLY